MSKNPPGQGGPTAHSAGLDAVTHDLVRARARELALIAGRAPEEVSPADHERAKRELAGKSERNRQDAILEALPESERWDPVPGSSGHQTPESPSDDEDDEGRSETEQLVDEGAMAAARDRMRQSDRGHQPNAEGNG